MTLSNIDLLTQETVEVAYRTRPHVRKKPAHRFGDFAVYRGENADLFNGDWRITHLPTGRCLASDFRTFDRAVDAMIEVARLRNDWAVIGDLECTDDLRDKVCAIVGKFGGRVGQREDSMPRVPQFNGYALRAFQ